MCLEHRRSGFSIVNGSWKIIEMLVPRSRATSRGPAASMSRPSKTISPPLATTPVGKRPTIARALRDLPLPDSPTIAIVSPSSRRRSTPATSVLRVLPATTSSRRSRTSRSGTPLLGSTACAATVGEPVVDPVTDDRDGGREEDDGEGGREHAGGVLKEQ